MKYELYALVTFSFFSYTIMLSCWNESPDERYSFADIVQILNEILEPLAGYMDFTQTFTKNET